VREAGPKLSRLRAAKSGLRQKRKKARQNQAFSHVSEKPQAARNGTKRKQSPELGTEALTLSPELRSPPVRADRNVAQRGDALELLRSRPDACAALAFFDPQHRGVLDHLAFGNEGARQRARSRLPAMTEDYIDACCREIARVLVPSGYLMLWADTFNLCQAHHLRIADVLPVVDLIAWDNLRLGMGKRSRRRGDYLLVLQRPPVTATNWRDHGIPSRWVEKADREIHPHAKPFGLIERLIAAVTLPHDLVIDPAAGSFNVLHAACRLGREFIGCDADVATVERCGQFVDPVRQRERAR
jgi:site-specific DNA-methyltransferase (adenine-specific)